MNYLLPNVKPNSASPVPTQNRRLPASSHNFLRSVIAVLLIGLLISSDTFAQTRKRTGKTRSRTGKARPAEPAQPVVTVIKEVNATAEQLRIISRFLYLYGRISNGLETAEAQARRSELNPALLDKHKQNKARLAENVGNLRAGIDGLLETLHAHPKLQQQYAILLSAPETIAAAEQLVNAGKFDEAGRHLVKAAEILTEVLAEIR